MTAADSYESFLATKTLQTEAFGLEPDRLPEVLFPFQSAIVAWAIRRGRAALFLDTGLGKTLCQLEWAIQSVGPEAPGLIVAPLAVVEQTIAEARTRLGLTVRKVAFPDDEPGLQITNYDKLHRFVGAPYSAIVLDESSILKSMDGKTRTMLLQEFTGIPRRLCCTATPAPNDVTELANHAEFLGTMPRQEMLATFFVHDSGNLKEGGGWRLKGHAREDFWRWVAKWAMWVRKPSDLGYSDEGYQLPALTIEGSFVDVAVRQDGALFDSKSLGGIVERKAARQQTLQARVARAVELVKESWRNDLLGIGQSTTPNTESNGSLLPAPTARPTEQRSESSTRPGESENPPSRRSSTPGSSGSSESTCLSTKSSSPIRTVDAPSAVLDLSGPERCSPSIMTTPPDTCGDSSAVPATRESDVSTTTQSLFTEHLNTCTKRQWLIWVDQNAEGSAVKQALGNDAVEISGKDDEDVKLYKERLWREGRVAALITKPGIYSQGVNWQHCANMIFVGLGDSWERYYQSLRRCWRFGQRRSVRAIIVTSEAEREIVENVQRKEDEARELADGVVAQAKEAMQEAVGARVDSARVPYVTDEVTGVGYRLLLGDCIERTREVPDASVGLSMFSLPFSSLYTYSASDRDMGNTRGDDEFFEHFKFLIPELKRVIMPGRTVVVHCQDLTCTKTMHGYIGKRDFSGMIVRAFQEHGWIYDGRITIDKDPQAAAIRTKSKQLLFVQKERDSNWLMSCLPDYLLRFRDPRDNEVPVKGDVTNEQWICWARPIWYGIREADTLNARKARAEKDEKHICPLQLETIARAVKLWTNKGETVFSPFMGIGSEGYVAVEQERKFVGVELKLEYFAQACANIAGAGRQLALL